MPHIVANSRIFLPRPPRTPLFANTVAAVSWDLIHSDDPDAFVSVSYVGFLVREIFGIGNINCYVYVATFTDSHSIEIQMSPSNDVATGTYDNEAAARVDVDKYCPRLGKLPLVYRRNINRMIGYPGNGVDEGVEDLSSEDQGHAFVIYADRANTRIANNDLEESFFHEGSHASIQRHGSQDELTQDDYEFLFSNEWGIAKARDNAFVTTYAASQNQEDFAESALIGYTMHFHPDRFPEPDRTNIARQIPNRIAFWRTIFAPRLLLVDGSQLLLVDGSSKLLRNLP